ncbi:hypothetical protein BJ878DRAFT_273960 [Calycina marina]|uniref:FAD-binding domain-containing protein n=1 Tax=Calycina marina TaxID=1763456 RepID=A0A9P7Z7V7_9HELO|nr:hypothetical protein BJ878DRAFT_273960 [Calycina marina]
MPYVVPPTRYNFEVNMHQGKIERPSENNLNQYAPGRRPTIFLLYQLDPDQDPEYLVVSELEQTFPDGSIIHKTARSKYLVGGDGARSRVRGSMHLTPKGEMSDHIWGVMDFVADSNFPDLRRRSAIHSDAGSLMVIPRERIRTGPVIS